MSWPSAWGDISRFQRLPSGTQGWVGLVSLSFLLSERSGSMIGFSGSPLSLSDPIGDWVSCWDGVIPYISRGSISVFVWLFRLRGAASAAVPCDTNTTHNLIYLWRNKSSDGTKRNVIGVIDLPLEMGPYTFQVTMQGYGNFPLSMLLGRRVAIHTAGAVPPSLHQRVKCCKLSRVLTLSSAGRFSPFPAWRGTSLIFSRPYLNGT